MNGREIRIRPSSAAISLGRRCRSAASVRNPATTVPPTKRNAPVTWKNSSQSYVDTEAILRCAKDDSYNRCVDARERHLRLLTETIEAVNSTLDLEEVLSLVARKVADALGADACFVYLYDERTDELVLRATHGTSVEEMTRRPRMRPGEGITGVAAAERAPVMIPAQAHLDPRFKAFANLRESEYESILAVPILARDKLAGALNVRTRAPRAFSAAEIDLLLAIAAQVAQTLEHGRAVLRGVLAQEIHHRVKNNLQTVASLLRLQARDSAPVDARKALDDSVNRILAIAAVHEVLTEQR